MSVVEGLTAEAYEHEAKIRNLWFKENLVSAMRQAFIDHGPRGEKYHTGVVQYTIAGILSCFGIEAGSVKQISERLRGRSRRAKQSHGSLRTINTDRPLTRIQEIRQEIQALKERLRATQ